ncbi:MULTISPECIES: terminase large subunit domain-containing protein [unclassified Streptomyces]|uniref:terminase large subunit domain-containing protein n=1 Tax=unclassified Streptomyces TaxID=2593676 RepID=UPI002E1F0F45
MLDLDALPLSRKQLRSIGRATARINLWHGAVRSGKTIASLLAFVIAVAAAGPSGLIIICGRSLQTIERNVFEPLMDQALFGPLAQHIHHTRGATTATILGRTVHLIGAADTRAKGRLRGLTAQLAYVDEATLLPEGFWTKLLARLSVTGARLYTTTNPDSPRHWLRPPASTAPTNSTCGPGISSSPITRPSTPTTWPASPPSTSDCGESA